MTPTWWRHVPYKPRGDEVTSYTSPVDSLYKIYYPVNLTSHARQRYSLMFNLFVLYMYIVKSDTTMLPELSRSMYVHL